MNTLNTSIIKHCESVPLGEMKVGQEGRVDSFVSNGSLIQRLQELGLVKDTPVRVKRFAPLGDPMEINVRGYSLSIRKSDANRILIRPL